MKKPLNMKGAGVLLLCAVVLAACNETTDLASTSTEATPATTTTGTAAAAVAVSGKAVTTDIIQKVEYTADDAYTDWASTNPTKISLTGTGATIEGQGAAVKDGKIAITKAGTYVLSGKLTDGQITVNVKDKGVVRLVLNGVEITNSTSSAIFIEEAGKAIISLQEGTENIVSDGTKYVYPDATTDEPNSAIFSKDDLTINGFGKLVVKGNYNNGITSKDKLKITGGTLDVKAVDDGVMGRDLVAIQAGTLTIDAGGHGIKTSNDKEGEEGYISLAGGTFTIKSGEDALHSSGGLDVSGGDLHINAGDDGIHAEVSLAIAGGTIDITQSNEGIEAPAVLISGGKTNVVSTDDGVNISSGDAESAEGGAAPKAGAGGAGAGAGQAGAAPAGGPGGAPGGAPGASGANSSNMLTITGGFLSVDSKGDGLDSNGSITMSGGTVVVNGPIENNNGSLDYDGTFVMTGGFLVAAGSSGMVQATSDKSTQAGVLMTYTKTQQAGALVHLEDSAGNTIITFAPAKNYQSVFVSSPNLKQDASYTLSSGGSSTGTATKGLFEGGTYQGGTKVVDFKTATLITWLSETGVTEARSGMMGGPGGGRQGGGGGGMPPQGGGQRPQRTAQ
ncbi:carbohydrate-binding domain-containing protein [Paenibacillus qinlingensis]|uniref:carbohydrate-binding domain-containing protein n=1 Tax=Paenibacillus qinlingensis TaxID=1837343 RepID=UPI001564E7DB|nr:carbohydrate-binding domain-containing protein [Paenibacillus qinlingensis]NQX61702.1 carbohydrate-binding domain-containing protein [Paenibacillus qinlingensis]